MTPRGFWSYARGDNEHLDKRLSDLRARVAGEISMLLGEDIGMFQDIYDIRTGDDWQDKLRAALTDASFMVPVLTPRYFTRKWCREEVITFIRLAEEADRTPLLFPIYFVADRRFDRKDHCKVRKAVARFQYLDYRQLRFESNPTRIDKAIYDFANDVVDRLEKISGPAPKLAKKPKAPPEAAAPKPVRSTRADAAEGAVRKAPPAKAVPQLVVDPFPGRGDHTSIQAAIDAAKPGSRIFIGSGLYRENLTLTKPLELIGDAPREEIVVECSEGDVLHVSATIARVSGLTLRRTEGKGDDVATWITAGRAEFLDCDFSCRSLSAVGVTGAESSPVFRRCLFRDSKECGLYFADGARGLVEDSEMSSNDLHGFTVLDGADPVIRRCVIRSNANCGVLVHDNGRGLMENSEIRDNMDDGVAIQSGGALIVRTCRISGNTHWGVWIADADSGGVFEGNDLRGNERGAWNIAEGAEKNLTRKDNTE